MIQIQSLRQIKTRIRSVENIKKITRAMEMVSVAKLRPLQDMLVDTREYSLKMEKIVHNLLASFKEVSHPLLETHNQAKRIIVCVVSSDTGLCGSYNHAVLGSADRFIQSQVGRGVDVVVIGKKGISYAKRRGWSVFDSYLDLHGRFSIQFADAIATKLMNAFLSKTADEVYMVYTYFDSASRLKPKVEKILNVEPGEEGERSEYLVEPDVSSLLGSLLERALVAKIRFAILNSFAAEHSARVVAMGEATDNALELLDGLILLRNKVRQASITKDIIEVISSAEALHG